MSLMRVVTLLVFTLFLSGCANVFSTATGNQSVEEDPGRRSLGTRIDDESIETSIKINLNAADELLRKSHVSVVSFNGIVLLVGQVPSQDMKNLATRVSTSDTRVKNVHNELEIAGATTFLSRSNDAWISAKIKTMMLADAEISGLRTKVVTENGVVYLMGLVTQDEATKTVDLVSNTKGVTKVVRAFEYIN